MANIKTNQRIKYPISTLSNAPITATFSQMRMELLVDEYGDNVYSNKQLTFDVFGDYLVSSHPIFNKFDEIYNDRTVVSTNPYTNEEEYTHISDIYLGGQVYFRCNPKSFSEIEYHHLSDNQTVKRKQLETYIHNNGIEMDAIGETHACFQYIKVDNGPGWKNTNLQPKITENLNEIVPFLKGETAATACKLFRPINNGNLFGTDPITIDSNRFITIIGKVRIPVELDTNSRIYYTPEENLWAAIYHENSRNLAAITELHVYKNNIAYFSLQVPVIRNDPIRVILPFRPGSRKNSTIVDPEYDIFRNIPENSACLFYYKIPDIDAASGEDDTSDAIEED